MVEELKTEYYFSGTLPEYVSTYVTREADNELLDALQKGKFCYVLNSRQSGKSSLRLRTMNRLSSAGVECASIDLSAIDIQSATQEKWYADLIVKLIDSFDLDVDFQQWWEKNQLNSSLLRFSHFLEKKLLVEVRENIVIFIDEIDSVLSLKFITDDFFAFIRSCYNQRVDNPEYNRLTFCLLGVASPSNLIEDKQRTPFNIGKAISLKGFQLHEVEPLQRGLEGKFSNPQAVMQEILEWTGGQPFLTQKLCQFMVEESQKENPSSVEQVVKSRIIENWESQDEPEHLRTIRDRILRDEQRAGYLLELYHKVRLREGESEISADDTIEQSELLLSGLVVRQQGKLRVYNPIYKEVFGSYWIETQLKNLRPYSEAFQAWIASGYNDESRLVRGKALQDAEEWAKNKSLSYQDRQFLAASRQKEIEVEIAISKKEAELEKERKDKEAVKQRTQLLTQANQKSQRLIRNGIIVIISALSFAVFSATRAYYFEQEASRFKKEIEEGKESLKLGRELVNINESDQTPKENRDKLDEHEEGISQESESLIRLDNNLKLALLNMALAVAYQEKDFRKAQMALEKVEDYLKKSTKTTDIWSEELQIRILVKKIRGNLFQQKDKNEEKKYYEQAFNLIKVNKFNIFDNKNKVQIITKEGVEAIHINLISLLSIGDSDVNLKKEVKKSLE
ncbi:AAA-like domain-containing protein [Tolypothrix sp. VBCCA 56010]|uniref:AAA-like domain-containing protein n=1 Tax=Tolypothrix sp. VBCCA 56010 TaxID=3137731 RepID=UPI003D7C53A7